MIIMNAFYCSFCSFLTIWMTRLFHTQNVDRMQREREKWNMRAKRFKCCLSLSFSVDLYTINTFTHFLQGIGFFARIYNFHPKQCKWIILFVIIMLHMLHFSFLQFSWTQYTISACTIIFCFDFFHSVHCVSVWVCWDRSKILIFFGMDSTLVQFISEFFPFIVWNKLNTISFSQLISTAFEANIVWV